MVGRFGNLMFQYAFARGYCQRYGLKLETDAWIGQRIFQIDDPLPSREYPQISECDLGSERSNAQFSGYAQNQTCADYYSKSDIQSWFRYRPDIEAALKLPSSRILAHHRDGDYIGSGYPVISKGAIRRAVRDAGFISHYTCICSSENPHLNQHIPPEMEFLQDFYMMQKAEVLFRANSTFSWWAGALSNGKVYAPRIDGLAAGRYHDDVRFEQGNHPRCAELSFVTDIHLKP